MLSLRQPVRYGIRSEAQGRSLDCTKVAQEYARILEYALCRVTILQVQYKTNTTLAFGNACQIPARDFKDYSLRS